MNKIRKNDITYVLAGRDKGKTGKVLKIDRKKCRVLVEGLNMMSHYTKKSEKTPNGGIIKSLSNDVTIFPNAPPMTTPTAMSTTFPLMANSLNSLIIVISYPAITNRFYSK